MGHQVIPCPKCDSWIMEGHNNWDCDNCGWSSNSKENKDEKLKKRKYYKFPII